MDLLFFARRANLKPYFAALANVLDKAAHPVFGFMT
jgi:hypothetical protein